METQNLTRPIQRTAKSVTPFACAKAAPLFAVADGRRYIFLGNHRRVVL